MLIRPSVSNIKSYPIFIASIRRARYAKYIRCMLDTPYILDILDIPGDEGDSKYSPFRFL